MNETISTLYEDRLIAEVYILKMTKSLYEIKETMLGDRLNGPIQASIQNEMSHINVISDAYHKTKFTKEEAVKANQLRLALNDLQTSIKQNHTSMQYNIDQSITLLNELSGIQETESKNIMKHADHLYLTVKTSSQVAFVLVILILLVLQAIVYTSKSIMPKVAPKFPNYN
jgi:hypothetical protein